MKFSVIRDVKTPQRANSTDAGIDFFVPNDYGGTILGPSASALVPAGVKADVPEGYALVAFNKSGVATKKRLQVGACVVDCGYQGEIHSHIYNTGQEAVEIEAGDKLVQFLLLPLGSPEVEIVPESELFDTESTRGSGGFGSSGVK